MEPVGLLLVTDGTTGEPSPLLGKRTSRSGGMS
jgi:hypothetical protein